MLDLEASAQDATMLSGCDALIHLAAHIPANHQDPKEAERCWRVNAWGTLQLVRAAAQAGVRQVIQTSSANAYAPTGAPPKEEASLFPQSRSYYLGSKIMQEIYASECGRAAGVNVATLRLSSVYGLEQHSGAPGVMAQAAMKGEPIHIKGGGHFGSDLVLVNDVAGALLLTLERQGSGPYNVGSGVRTTIAELAAMLAELTNAPILQDAEPDGSSDFGFPALDITRIKALGYSPTPITTGLRTMLAELRPVSGGKA